MSGRATTRAGEEARGGPARPGWRALAGRAAAVAAAATCCFGGLLAIAVAGDTRQGPHHASAGQFAAMAGLATHLPVALLAGLAWAFRAQGAVAVAALWLVGWLVLGGLGSVLMALLALSPGPHDGETLAGFAAGFALGPAAGAALLLAYRAAMAPRG